MALSSVSGRKIIKTSLKIVNDVKRDAQTIAKILDDALSQHEINVKDETMLFDIFFNNGRYWSKEKETRTDINNKITVDDAYAISRTITGYCFGEPIKYISRDTTEKSKKQEQVEKLSEFLDYQHNHDATIMAELSASVCGLGYKLALPSSRDELSFSGVPFIINTNLIAPQNAFCVYSADITNEKVLGVIISNHYDEEGQVDGRQFTVWTKYNQFVFVENGGDYKYKAQKNPINRIPLIEVERNAFRKGDWEICLDLLECKNKLLSNRVDDIQQVVDYVMVLTNCEFETDDDRDSAKNDRLIMVKQKDPKSPPKVEILKNPIDQTGVQTLATYIDQLIETTVGIPSRAERSGGGHDTGTAVYYRNGFRDLENNAGMIIPKMDKAELEFIGICLAYSHNLTGGKDKLNKLQPFDIRCKFVRSLSDDPITASTAYATFRSAGMNDIDALVASKAVTDPAEVHKNNVTEEESTYKLNLERQKNENISKTVEDNNQNGIDG